jgi:hypothetical protein
MPTTITARESPIGTITLMQVTLTIIRTRMHRHPVERSRSP